ncbi:MAG: hypothetical protein QNJ31_02300 [Candidatus Caenarcaniphilales bacterium]|nr:hypothetical protein [Candidatus Caenarcaniphilales bacterium]
MSVEGVADRVRSGLSAYGNYAMGNYGQAAVDATRTVNPEWGSKVSSVKQTFDSFGAIRGLGVDSSAKMINYSNPFGV